MTSPLLQADKLPQPNTGHPWINAANRLRSEARQFLTDTKKDHGPLWEAIEAFHGLGLEELELKRRFNAHTELLEALRGLVLHESGTEPNWSKAVATLAKYPQP